YSLVERASGDDSRGDEGIAGDPAHPRQVHRSYWSNVHTHLLVTHEMCGLGMTTRRLPGMHYTTTSLGADGGRGALGRPVAMERSDAGVALVTGPAPGLS